MVGIVFELSRWPKEAHTPIRKGLEALKAVPGGQGLEKGKALDLQEATLEVDGQVLNSIIKGEDKSILFEVDLKEGPARVKTWFKGPNATTLGAYYVYVRKVSN